MISEYLYVPMDFKCEFQSQSYYNLNLRKFFLLRAETANIITYFSIFS